MRNYKIIGYGDRAILRSENAVGCLSQRATRVVAPKERLMSLMNNDDVILVREWDSDIFHQKVLELEAKGYLARKESYRVMPEIDPENGKIIHLHTIEMFKPGGEGESEIGARHSSSA
jgi:hypothetical protein